jgi:uncharacterized protein GlcG (DUF336 family)
MISGLLGRSGTGSSAPARRRLRVERLESRDLPSVSAVLAGGVLMVNGDANHNLIRVQLDTTNNQIVVRNFVDVVASFSTASVTSLVVNAGDGQSTIVTVDPAITLPTMINGGNGSDSLRGGGGTTSILGGTGNDKLFAGPGQTTLNGDGGINKLFYVKPIDTAIVGPQDSVLNALPAVATTATAVQTLNPSDVQQLIQRAAAANSNQSAIIAVVDRGGRLLGVRVEGGVAPQITGNIGNLVFAIDGAIAEARTAAFFANGGAPLTSRTIQFISQSTMTQREVESNPSILDPNSTIAGPGFVAPIGIGGHFPPGIPHTPQVDLYDIEATNRDTSVINGTVLPSRFNVPTQFIPSSILTSGQTLAPPDSYGFISGLMPGAQPRGIGTMPGGIPIYKNGQLVGGIGVFFPGTTGYADEENSALQANYDPTKPDLAEEAEFMAFAAVGGFPPANTGIGTINGIAPVPGIALPSIPPNRIDLVGITLPLFGPEGTEGPQNLFRFGAALGLGDPNSGTQQRIDPAGDLFAASTPVPEGWLVTPHDGDGITAAQVQQIIQDGINQANLTRAAIRLPLNTTTRMVFAVADRQGNIVGLFRMPDATVFSIAVAVAKARNTAYYDNGALVQPIDQLPGVPPGTVLTNRSFRYLAEPRFPEGIDGAPPGPFSILNDGGSDPRTGLNVGPPLPASTYFNSVQGHNAFVNNTNFHDPFNPLNQNGIVFFPGSSGVYIGDNLLGGFGVSGDGVDQDDVVTTVGIGNFAAPVVSRIDQTFVRGIRVPYAKFNRNPEGGIVPGQ